MGNIFNDDFSDFIQSLNDNEVAYILVGGSQLSCMAIQGLPAICIFGWTELKIIMLSF